MKIRISHSLLRRAVLAVLSTALPVLSVAPAAAQVYPENSPEHIEFTVDLAEDMDKYVEPRVPAGAEPLRGSFFLTEGRIYPMGTIPSTGGDQFDPNAPGSIGTWYCKGTFLVRGSEFDKAERAVLTDQLLLLSDNNRAISTSGTEGNGTVTRAVTGGTGPYAGYVGVQRQQFLGFNKTGGVNLRVTIMLRKARRLRDR